MAIIFAAPAATGKTHFKEALKKHFGCDAVYDDGDVRRSSRFPGKNALVLCQTFKHAPPGRILSRDEMNRAMVAVGGIPIWNDDGSVNIMGERKGLK